MTEGNPKILTNHAELCLLIDGKWIGSAQRQTRPVINPSDGSTLGALPIATPADIARATEAAERAFPAWRDMAPRKRAAILHRAAALLRSHTAVFSRLMALEMGKPIADGPAEVERAAELLEWHAEEGLRAYGRVIPSGTGLSQSVLRRPIGPVAAFTPWNGPVASPARKISAALAAGCSIVIKPAEETPAGAILIAKCLMEAGLPDGVLNMVFGDPAAISADLIASPAIRMITFTGSVPVGRALATAAGRYLKPLVLELGGHCPVIVCDSVDVEATAALAARAKFRNAGQICISPTRFLVQENIHDAFAERMKAEAEKLVVGDPLNAATQMGPLANARRLAGVDALVRDATSHGARLLTGGKQIGTQGWFYAPTILADIPTAAMLCQEEPFGPIATLSRFRDLDDACRQANSTAYGLFAYAFTDSARDIAFLSERVEAGTLSVNHFGGAAPDIPFGGVRDSGYGREGGAECFDGYLVTKLVSHRTGVEPAARATASSQGA